MANPLLIIGGVGSAVLGAAYLLRRHPAGTVGARDRSPNLEEMTDEMERDFEDANFKGFTHHEKHRSSRDSGASGMYTLQPSAAVTVGDAVRGATADLVDFAAKLRALPATESPAASVSRAIATGAPLHAAIGAEDVTIAGDGNVWPRQPLAAAAIDSESSQGAQVGLGLTPGEQTFVYRAPITLQRGQQQGPDAGGDAIAEGDSATTVRQHIFEEFEGNFDRAVDRESASGQDITDAVAAVAEERIIAKGNRPAMLQQRPAVPLSAPPPLQ